MPKIIPDLKERIVERARKMLMAEGYRAFSMRALARQCDIAPGTLYNYFPGKDALIACVTMEDWDACLGRMAAISGMPFSQGLAKLGRLLSEFTDQYRMVWEQYGSSVASYTAKYHRTVRKQLSDPIREVLRRGGAEALLPLADVLAETMLACALNTDLGAEQFDLLASSWTPVGNKMNKGDFV